MKKQIFILLMTGIFIVASISPATTSITLDKKNNVIESDNENTENKGSMRDTLFDFYVRFLMRIAHKPSLVAGIIYKDEMIWSKAYGYYDLENRKEATTDILYMQASVSKTICATALMQLYEQGKFNLTDDVNKYLPFDMRNPNYPNIPITIEMVLSHHSSMAYDNLFWLCLSYMPGDPDLPSFPYPWLEEYLVPGGSAYSSSTWSEFKPGEKYLYANVGFSVVAYLVEILSCQNFNDYCREHIFDPLEMENSSFRLKDHDLDNLAVPYEYKNDEYFRHPHYGIIFIYPAITLRTSIEEYSHFLIAMMNGGVWNGKRILDESTVDLMFTPPFEPEREDNYGLGWQIKKKSFGRVQIMHGGAYVGYDLTVVIRPEKETAIMVFANELDAEFHVEASEFIAMQLIKKALFFKASRLAS